MLCCTFCAVRLVLLLAQALAAASLTPDAPVQITEGGQHMVVKSLWGPKGASETPFGVMRLHHVQELKGLKFKVSFNC